MTRMRHPLHRRLSDRFLYLLFLAGTGLVRLLPRRLVLRCGMWLGRLVQLFARRDRRVTEENLRQAFPELSGGELRRLRRQVFEHLGCVGAEVLLLQSWNDADIPRLFTIRGREQLAAALAQERGVLLMSAHIGYWEAISYVIRTLGVSELAGVAKPIKNPHLNRYLAAQRLRRGGLLIDAHRGAARILRALYARRTVIILMDQRTSEQEGVPVPFFGRDAWTTPVLAKMAARGSIPILPCFVYRLPDLTYEMVFEPVLVLADDSSPEALRRHTAELTAIIEAAIRRAPGQWCWNYRRWIAKNRPAEVLQAQRAYYGSANPFDDGD